MVSAFRNGVGDTGTYRGLFDAAPSSIKEFFQVIPLEDEWGFTLYYTLIKEFISDKSQWFIIISAVVTLVSIFIVFYRYSEYIELAIFYFITMGCYLVTMNGIRQYLVSAILFLAFPWIIKKKWYLYIPLVLILSTCHVSALIFLIIYFVGNKKAWGGMDKNNYCIGSRVIYYISCNRTDDSRSVRRNTIWTLWRCIDIRRKWCKCNSNFCVCSSSYFELYGKKE